MYFTNFAVKWKHQLIFPVAFLANINVTFFELKATQKENYLFCNLYAEAVNLMS